MEEQFIRVPTPTLSLLLSRLSILPWYSTPSPSFEWATAWHHSLTERPATAPGSSSSLRERRDSPLSLATQRGASALSMDHAELGVPDDPVDRGGRGTAALHAGGFRTRVVRYTCLLLELIVRAARPSLPRGGSDKVASAHFRSLYRAAGIRPPPWPSWWSKDSASGSAE